LKLAYTNSFKRDYRKLPEEEKKKLEKQLKFLLKDRDYPSLRAKKIKGHGDIWEGRISREYRFTFQIEGNYYILRRAGSHDTLKNP